MIDKHYLFRMAVIEFFDRYFLGIIAGLGLALVLLTLYSPAFGA